MSLALTSLAGLVSVYGYLLRVVDTVVPQPYMDEIFHVPQAQVYCSGDYQTWDPKITTPPGLYLVSNALISGLNLLNFTGSKLSCSTNILRATNCLLGLGVYLVLIGLLQHIRPQQSTTRNVATAFVISFFPVGFFYNFMYYTDTGSTFFVLLSYLLSLKKRNYLAAQTSFISIWFRQTNIIWICFILGNVVCTELMEVSASRSNPSIGLRLSQFKHSSKMANSHHASLVKHTKRFCQLIQLIGEAIRDALRNWKRVFAAGAPYLINILLFIGFLKWNGGIVLGDKSNHIAGLHFPQLFYFVSFTSVFLAPYLITIGNARQILHSLGTLRFLFLALVGMNYAIYKFTFEHPFLLSDNRHYSFYVWKKIYRFHGAVRYLLSPVYLLASQLLWQTFQELPVYWCLLYVVSISLALVPSPLLEFRYFILPFLMIRIHASPKREPITRLLLELTIYVVVNSLTFYMFLYRPFTWPNVEELQRFMW
ncbi:hypothetical protein K493DRAFT_236820 [Basidiobolus meristosporus CBS 931.73]|uniref:Dol-P-Glc:Glc(2)Man(9)GlcNAc(2)-PP-Dol alpha-1,2-glucosyltransferase n=1 Tax=Basidiobolus meristosporus CBS 931.73 TaxID=1314790 RepID=A0A1Y1XRH4_9FUNG|nr:hypothetical protein K493DRAFT_236820 [Basidiobolus meristosporus CBS 931.73]|eukprot:ORX88362.1 hypothetical protein K493DRAFT_236820 [Basidiobolus meristosporus CBS 931.73]